MLFEIENIEITKKEELILLRLQVKHSKSNLETANEWYDSLPEKIRKQIHYLDFLDFTDKLHLARFADKRKKRYRIFGKGENRFEITIE